jgi:hypothetical protein
MDRRIADLQALRATLQRARAQADRAADRGDEALVCRIIENAAPQTGSERA